MRIFPSVLLLWIVAVPLAAQPPKTDAKAIAATIAPFVDEQTLAAIHIAPARIDPAELARLVLPSRSEQDRRDFQNEIARWKDGCAKLGAREVFVLFSLADWNEPIAYVLPLTAGSSDPKAIRELLDPFVGKANLESALRGKTFIAGSKMMVNHLKSIKPAARPELAAAFEAAGDSDIQAVVIPTSDQRKVILELLPLASKWKGSDVLKTWIAGAKWAAAGASLSPKLMLRARVQAQSNESAKSLAERMPDLLKLIAKDVAGMTRIPPDVLPKVEPVGSEIHADLTSPEAIHGLAQFVATAIDVADQSRRMKNLRKVALALHNYYSAISRFPGWAWYNAPKPASAKGPGTELPNRFAKPNKDAKPLLSWRVWALPYMDQDALFHQFKLDEPWDSEHNKRLISKMPAVFRTGNRRLDDAGKTRIMVPVGENTIFPPDGRKIGLQDIADGVSNTIMVVEAAEDSATIWTKPGDWDFDAVAADNPFKGLLDPEAPGLLAVMADGHVVKIPKTMSPGMLQLFFMRNSGKPKKVP